MEGWQVTAMAQPLMSKILSAIPPHWMYKCVVLRLHHSIRVKGQEL